MVFNYKSIRVCFKFFFFLPNFSVKFKHLLCKKSEVESSTTDPLFMCFHVKEKGTLHYFIDF